MNLQYCAFGLLWSAILALGSADPVVAQTSDPLAPLIGQFSSQTVQARADAFYAALALADTTAHDAPPSVSQQVQDLLAAYPADSVSLSNGLANLLVVESADTTLGTLMTSSEDESSTDFLLDVAEAVSSLKSPSTIPALARAITLGATVTDTLASFGPRVLGSILPLVSDGDFQTRDATAYTLATMLTPRFAALYSDSDSQSKIRAGLQTAIQSFSGDYAFAQGYFQTVLNSIPPSVVGDLNGDGAVNCADVGLIRASFGKSAGQPGFDIRADVNGDGVVNKKDLTALRKLAHKELECERERGNRRELHE